MKKQTLRTITITSLFLLLAAVSVQAQVSSARKMSVNIPFKFAVGERELPAGDYTVRCITQSCAGISIQNSETRQTAIVLANRTVQPARAQNGAQLVFTSSDNGYYLSQVWMAATNIGSEISKPRRAPGLAQNSRAPRTITLSAHAAR